MNSKNILFYLTIVLAFALSGCLSNNELIEEYEVEREISFRVVQTMSTRSLDGGVSRPIPDGEPLQFNTGYLYLVNAQGIIMRHFRIGAAYGEPCNITNTIGRTQLMRTSGVTIESVPGSVTRVVIIANYGGTPPLPATGNVGNQSHLNRPLNIVSQYRAWNVNLTNCPDSRIGTGASERLNGNLLRTGINNDVYVYSTTIHLAPTVARFEIADITGMGMIQSFTVDGIFMDDFYRLSTIGGGIVPASIHTGGSEVNNFNATSHTTAAALSGATPNAPIGDTNFGIHVWRAATDNWTGTFDTGEHNPTSMIVRPGRATTPDLNNVTRPNSWSFQVFAGNYRFAPATPAAGTTVPRIIIRLSNVRLMDGSPTGALFNNDGVAFLTIRDLHYITPANQRRPLQYIRASRVYRIEEGWLTFDEFDLGERPNMQTLDVDVSISLAVWNDVNLEVVI